MKNNVKEIKGDIHSVDPDSLAIIIENLEGRLRKYKQRVFSTSDSKEEAMFAHAIGTLVVLRNDLTALLGEIKVTPSISPEARKEVENLLNDVLIQMKKDELSNEEEEGLI